MCLGYITYGVKIIPSFEICYNRLLCSVTKEKSWKKKTNINKEKLFELHI